MKPVEGGARIVAGGTREGFLFQPNAIYCNCPEMRSLRGNFALVVVSSSARTIPTRAPGRELDASNGLQAGIFSE